MSNRAFLYLAVLAIALGGALGAILIVVIDDGDEGSLPIASIPSSSSAGDGPDFERLSQLTGRVASGDVDSEDLEELEELVAQFPGGPDAGVPLGGDDGPSMFGTIESLNGADLSINTPIGPLQVTVGEDTSITSISETEGTLEDLTEGLRLTLTGERNEEGLLEATSVRVIPEGLQIPQRGQLAGQLEPGLLAGLIGLSDEEMAALALQGAIMAAQARGGGNVTVESPEEGVTIITETMPLVGGDDIPDGIPDGALVIPGETRTFSFEVPSQAGGPGANALTGVLESLEDGVIELTTPRGPVKASIVEDTAIAILRETDGSLDDLTPGAQVMVSGQPDESGNWQASSITLLPDSLAIPAGRPFGGRGGFGGPGFGGGRGSGGAGGP